MDTRDVCIVESFRFDADISLVVVDAVATCAHSDLPDSPALIHSNSHQSKRIWVKDRHISSFTVAITSLQLAADKRRLFRCYGWFSSTQHASVPCNR
jgi:hypothetical protein